MESLHGKQYYHLDKGNHITNTNIEKWGEKNTLTENKKITLQSERQSYALVRIATQVCLMPIFWTMYRQ